MSPSKTARKIDKLKEVLQTLFFQADIDQKPVKPSQAAKSASQASQAPKSASEGISDKGSQPKDLSQEIAKDTVWGLALESYHISLKNNYTGIGMIS